MSITCNICDKPATKTGPGSKTYIINNVDNFGIRGEYCLLITPLSEYGIYRSMSPHAVHICGRCIEKMNLAALAKEASKRREERKKTRQGKPQEEVAHDA